MKSCYNKKSELILFQLAVIMSKIMVQDKLRKIFALIPIQVRYQSALRPDFWRQPTTVDMPCQAIHALNGSALFLNSASGSMDMNCLTTL